MAIDPQIYRTWGTGWFFIATTIASLIISVSAFTVFFASLAMLDTGGFETGATLPLYVSSRYLTEIGMAFALPAVAACLFPVTNRLIIRPARVWMIPPYFGFLNCFWVIALALVLRFATVNGDFAITLNTVVGLTLGGILTGLATAMILALRAKFARRSIHQVF